MRSVRKAFSLIELLVVLTIIAILMAFTLPSLSKARDSAEFIKWSAYSRGILTDPQLLVYWTFENQNISDNHVANQASGGGYSLAPHVPDVATIQTALNTEQPEFSFAPPSSSQLFDISPVAKTTWAASDFTLKLMGPGDPIDPGIVNYPMIRFTTEPFWTQGRWNKKSAIALGRLPDGSMARTGMRAAHHDDLNLSGKAFTLWIWARSEDGRAGTLLSKHDMDNRVGYFLEYRYFNPIGDAVYLVIETPSGNMYWPTWVRNGSLTRNEWALFTFVCDGQEITSYANAQRRATRDITSLGSFDTEKDFVVGARAWPPRGFRGDVDEIGIVQRAMTEQEILDMYEAGTTTTYGGAKK